MIVWTWIKRISCLIGKSIWFLFTNGCFFWINVLNDISGISYNSYCEGEQWNRL